MPPSPQETRPYIFTLLYKMLLRDHVIKALFPGWVGGIRGGAGHPQILRHGTGFFFAVHC